MKKSKMLFKGCIYFLMLIGVIWSFSIFITQKGTQSKPVAATNFNPYYRTSRGSNESTDGKRKTQAKYPIPENKNLNTLGYKNLVSDKSVTILMYHYTTENRENYMSIPRDKFREQMKYLKENGYTVISLDELYSFYTKNSYIPEKAIVITFDDGYENNYTYAYPILKEFGFKATIFVITSKINQYLYLTTKQLKELNANGIDIESHTVSHPELNKLHYYKQFDELKQSKITLERILGKEIKYLAYPYGQYNRDTIRAAMKLKYKMAMGTYSSKVRRSNGLYNLNRIAVKGPTDIQQFKALLDKK